MDVDHLYEQCIPGYITSPSIVAIATVSHGTQDVSVRNVIVSEADMSGLAYKRSFHI